MPVGAGGEDLRTIEAALSVDDPVLVESFQRWDPPPDELGDGGTTIIGRRFGLALLFGLVPVAVGPTVALVLLLLVGIVLTCVVSDRSTNRGPASASAA